MQRLSDVKTFGDALQMAARLFEENFEAVQVEVLKFYRKVLNPPKGVRPPSNDSKASVELVDDFTTPRAKTLVIKPGNRTPIELFSSSIRVLDRDTNEMKDKRRVFVRRFSKRITACEHPGRNMSGHRVRFG